MRLIQFTAPDLPWQVVAISEGMECPLRRFLMEAEPNYRRHADRMRGLIEHAASVPRGPIELGDAVCHQVDARHQIYEFIKGPLRVLWFYGEGGKLVICSGGFVKKSQKTPRHEIDRAVEAQRNYRIAARRGDIRIEMENWQP